MNDLLSSAYQREDWIDFLQSKFLPNDFKLKKQAIDIEFKSRYIKPQAYWIGDCGSLDDLAIIEISHASENDPRIGLSRDAFRLMAELNLSKALFFFVSDNSPNYRFSLITLDLKLEGTGVKYSFSNPKRFSFFLGNDAKIKTPQSFLFHGGRVRDFEDLQSRFSVEVVNKEFYQEIQRMFYSLVGGKIHHKSNVREYAALLKLPDTGDTKTMQEFGVRLIGRLVFCWFLKKKLSDMGNPLIPDALLSEAAVQESYYHNVLEPLFFELLNSPLPQRHPDFRSPLYDSVPFLNGGLFDPTLHRDYYISSTPAKAAQPAWNLKIPDSWFQELFGILETYNFTIDENTSIDVELSVDPEMLGRIFENLLAELNPETGETARNATGSFYTPRAIVEYMVDEALIQYLSSKTTVAEADLRALLDYQIEESGLSPAENLAVIDALDAIKVLDPACGSGAFPIGILQKMLLVLNKVDPESKEWVQRQLDRLPGSHFKAELKEKLQNENFKYSHKMGIIQNAIYGVDIQPIATEISKLRLFLSLIVDESVIEDMENKNIHPLPNLSFKFVTANSLISLGTEEATHLRDLNIIKGFDDIRERYLHAHSALDKEQIRKDFAKLNQSLMDKLTGKVYQQSSFLEETQSHIDFKIDSDSYLYKLLNWDPFQDKASAWFDPKWMFGIKDGFDIVIGNPPYRFLSGKGSPVARLKARGDYLQAHDLLELLDTYKRLYPLSSQGCKDYYKWFIDLSFRLLKEGGISSYITPNTYIAQVKYRDVASMLCSRNSLKRIIDLGFSIFEVPIVPCAIYLSIKSPGDNNDFQYSDLKHVSRSSILKAPLHETVLAHQESIRPSSGVISIFKHTLAESIYSRATKLLKSEVKISEGDHGIVIDESTISSIELPNHVRAIHDKLMTRYQPVPTVWIPESDSPKSCQNLHKGIRMFIRKTGDKIVASVPDNSECAIAHQNIYVAKPLKDTQDALFYFLGLLNSSTINFLYQKGPYGQEGRVMAQFRVHALENLPIPELNDSITKAIGNAAHTIVNSYNCMRNDDFMYCSSFLIESQIDLMVYKLYELTYSEAKLIDPDIDSVLASFGLSAQDYERMSIEDLSKLKVV